jgi:hypothetical protein
MTKKQACKDVDRQRRNGFQARVAQRHAAKGTEYGVTVVEKGARGFATRTYWTVTA